MRLVLTEKQTGKFIIGINVNFFGFGVREKSQELLSKGIPTDIPNKVSFPNVQEAYKVLNGHIGKMATGKLLHYSSMYDCIFTLQW